MRGSPRRPGRGPLRPSTIWLGLLGGLALMLALASSASAATFTVTNTNDSGHGSLRAAIHHANQNEKSFDRIPIKATGKIALNKNLPSLRSDLAISGPGARKLTVAPKHSARFVQGFANWGHTVSVSGMTVAGADSGAIRNLHHGVNHGRFFISRTVLRNSYPAIASQTGSVTVSRSTLISNRRGIISNGAVTVFRSTFSGNHAGDGGAAIDAYGPVSISQSTFSGNSVGARGTSAVILAYDTTLESTIIANSSGANCALAGLYPELTSLGHNLADDDTCHLTAQGDQPNTDPLLRPLDDYGGPTKTFALRPSSPAVDAGVADGATTDQRGLPRIVDYPGVPKAGGGDNSDIGAFELQAAP